MSDSNEKEEIKIFKNEEAILLDHNYDGIQELDHPLPRWWLGVLYATIVFGAVYWFYYTWGGGPTSQQELSVAMEEIESKRPAGQFVSDDDYLDFSSAAKDPTKIKHGNEVFSGKCFACHGDKGQGIIGPNLTDDFWIHGTGTMKDIAEVVEKGVADKGMPPWETILSKDELTDVVAFIRSIRHSNPAGAKAPQGNPQDPKD